MEDRKKTLETLLVIVAGLLTLFLWTKNPWFWRGALAVAIIGVFSPWLSRKIHAGWMLLAQALGWFNSRVLLAAVFFLVLTPIAWLARRFGSAAAIRRQKQSGGSYYTDRQHTYTPQDLENTW